MTAVLVTGAGGFLGRVLTSALISSCHTVRAASRDADSNLCQTVAIGDIGAKPDWSAALSGMEAVVHLAARVHLLRGPNADAIAEYRRINVAATIRLAREASRLGVRRFVFVSSIKVNGESTPGKPFSEGDKANPLDPYAVSKWEAELALQDIAAASGLELVIVRPPLVYGPRVGANFLRLMRLVDRGVPLPLARVDNRRSMIFVGNLVDAIITCIDHPGAARETFLVSDGEDVSTPELIRRMAQALAVVPRFFPFPPPLLQAMAVLAGKGDEAVRLLGSLAIDASHIKQRLGWVPPFSMDQGLAETVCWFRQMQAEKR